ncbi:MAG: hypothetical protein RI906_639, partial [Pseudomonadota bacterium]
ARGGKRPCAHRLRPVLRTGSPSLGPFAGAPRTRPPRRRPQTCGALKPPAKLSLARLAKIAQSASRPTPYQPPAQWRTLRRTRRHPDRPDRPDRLERSGRRRVAHRSLIKTLPSIENRVASSEKRRALVHAPPAVEDPVAARGKPLRAISASPARSKSAGHSLAPRMSEAA